MTPEALVATTDTVLDLVQEWVKAEEAAQHAPKSEQERLREKADEALDEVRQFMARVYGAGFDEGKAS